MKEGKKSLVCSVRNALTTSDSIDSGRWTFRDGVPVHEELKGLELIKIRAVCARQSWSQWTSIATRERLYQFMVMSGEDAQNEMWLNMSAPLAEDEVRYAMNSTISDSANFNLLASDEQGQRSLQPSGSNTWGRKR